MRHGPVSPGIAPDEHAFFVCGTPWDLWWVSPPWKLPGTLSVGVDISCCRKSWHFRSARQR